MNKWDELKKKTMNNLMSDPADEDLINECKSLHDIEIAELKAEHEKIVNFILERYDRLEAYHEKKLKELFNDLVTWCEIKNTNSKHVSWDYAIARYDMTKQLLEFIQKKLEEML